MSVKVISDEITLDELVKEADMIWSAYRAKKLKRDDDEAHNAFHDETLKEHKKFAQSYPVVFKYLCLLGKYNSQAFIKYVKYISVNPCKSEDDWLRKQAEYLAFLERKLNPRADVAKVRRMVNEAYSMIKEEHDTFKRETERLMKEFELKREMLRKDNREELRKYLESEGKKIDDKIIFESDVIPSVVEILSADINSNKEEDFNPQKKENITADNLLN